MTTAHAKAGIKGVAVIGLGKVGSLVGSLLNESGFEVQGADARERPGLPFDVSCLDVGDPAKLDRLLDGRDAVISCLPYDLNVAVATAAHRAGVHYFDLTEDVSTRQQIMKLSDTARAVLAPQCGLAPGFIAIVGAHLTKGFERLRSIHLRVGALPQHPSGLLGYAFNWSPEGVVNEYLNDCEVIKGGKKMLAPPMEQLETIVIQGLPLEAFTTSGGLGTMCDTYEGRVEELNYKTLRYPGHCKLMRFFFQELHMKDRREEAGNILVNAKPPVSEDLVHIHAAVEGWREERLFREEFVRTYYPKDIAGKTWRAISWTTAASVCGVLEMVSNGALAKKGFLKHEDIPIDAFMTTRDGALFKTETDHR